MDPQISNEACMLQGQKFIRKEHPRSRRFLLTSNCGWIRQVLIQQKVEYDITRLGFLKGRDVVLDRCFDTNQVSRKVPAE
jgi:uncharacterized membrane protein